MQTQQDLINLISLKISDEVLIKHFDALGLKQPKSATPNNSSSDIAHKELGVNYYFNYDVTHEACHPPKREGKPAKWATYLTSISFINERNILKTPDTKPEKFWNVSPPQTADLTTVKAFFGEPTATTENVIYFCKKINDLIEISCQFSIKQQRARAIWASIIEEYELISYLYFRDLAMGESDDSGSGMADQNIMCMVVKWLHDNKHLNAAQNVALPADKSVILSFVHSHFKGKIWENQLNQSDPHIYEFVSASGQNNNGLKDESGNEIKFYVSHIYLKTVGKWDEYCMFETQYNALDAAGKDPGEFYWLKQEALLKSLPINETDYALFANALDDNLALFKRLKSLEINKS